MTRTKKKKEEKQGKSFIERHINGMFGSTLVEAERRGCQRERQPSTCLFDNVIVKDSHTVRHKNCTLRVKQCHFSRVNGKYEELLQLL